MEAQKILSCVVRIAQRNRSFGKGMIVDILRGTDNDRIRQSGLMDLPTFGLLSELPVHRIRVLLDFLVHNGYLSLTAGEYPVVQHTELSGEILRGKKTLEMKLPRQTKSVKEKEKEKEKPDKHGVKRLRGSRPVSKGDSSTGAVSVDEGEDLFAHLKELRKQFAVKAGVPAYVVFTDAALHDMVRKQPLTLEAFLDVSGVGKAKADKYGVAFTEAIADFLGNRTGGM